MNDIIRDTGFIQSDASWDLPQVVADLKQIRLVARQNDYRLSESGNYELPSADVLVNIVKEIISALFPRRLGSPSLRDDNEDFFVSHKLFIALSALQRQVLTELNYFYLQNHDSVQELKLRPEVRTAEIVNHFSKSLPKIRMLLDQDLIAGFRGDPAANCLDQVLLCYPGMRVMIYHRLAHELYKSGVPLIARIISESAHSETGIDIHPGASIGGGFFIDHGTGVVIGETAIIGERVRLYQAVTLGAKRFPADDNGELSKGLPRHPIIENDVVIYAGATILGRVTIGRGSTIGGNVWLTHSVPSNSHVTQADFHNDVTGDGAGI